ncbi:alpha/beta fold hydrolase [Gluconacetobacter sp. 1c LMG 22058]|uniref:Alpha/beta fold hydrolase n=1 Tax=Gluconacetobacter dulcium TaxID=2729096 RepID=A0A7W4K3K8_9PROT|nr:alpha/beta fold hydrolase [Gluconacetobacter dulcium]MBB2199744.1 alpha/beta fold hydrolase [Gluconacetobacter dulcium]
MKGDWVKHGSSTAPVVVFVHGILSSGESCWRHASGAYWPEIVAKDTEMSDLGVYVFTYRTGFFSGSYSLADAVDALKEHLTVDGINGSTGIVFVCHSMGGIVVRRYLVSRATELIERGVQIAIFLLASPSLGADYADWCKPLARFLGHSQGDALRFVRFNTWLGDLDRDFLNLKEQGRLSIVGKELTEDRFVAFRWLWRKQVVEPFSGARYFGEPYKVPESDHFSIAKIESELAIQHRQLKYFVAEWRRTKVKAVISREYGEQSGVHPADPGCSSSPVVLCDMPAGEFERLNIDVRPSRTPLSVLGEVTAPAYHPNSEATMSDPTTRHLIDRFWDLDASDRRDVALELGLIVDEEIDLPEPQRYNVALMRASERNLLDRLEQLVKVRE